METVETLSKNLTGNNPDKYLFMKLYYLSYRLFEGRKMLEKYTSFSDKDRGNIYILELSDENGRLRLKFEKRLSNIKISYITDNGSFFDINARFTKGTEENLEINGVDISYCSKDATNRNEFRNRNRLFNYETLSKEKSRSVTVLPPIELEDLFVPSNMSRQFSKFPYGGKVKVYKSGNNLHAKRSYNKCA